MHRDGEPGCECARCEQDSAERMADALRSRPVEVSEPAEGEPGYKCPDCGEPYDSKMRTPADRVCFQCRYPERD